MKKIRIIIDAEVESVVLDSKVKRNMLNDIEAYSCTQIKNAYAGKSDVTRFRFKEDE